MNKNTPRFGVAGNIIYILKDIYLNKKSLFAVIVISSLCGSLLPLTGVWLPKAVVELVQSGAEATAVFKTLGPYLAALILLQTVSAGAESYMQNSYYDLRLMYMRRIVSKSMRQSYRRLESEEGQNCYWKARSVVLEGDLQSMLGNLISMATNFFGFASFSWIISTLNPLIVVLLIAMSLVTFGFMRRGSEIWESVRGERAGINSQTFLLAENGCDAAMGKDIRLYGMRNLFTEKIKALARRSMQLYNRQRSGYIQEHFVTMVLNFLRDAGAYAYLIYRTLNGGISAGDFVLYFGAIAGFSSWMGGLTWRIDVLRRNYYDIKYFREFMEYEDEKIDFPEKIHGEPEIEFKNVSFSYDGKTDVLKNFNLKIRPGEHIALIGVNGAGKSTIVKLLCGFYAPSSGSVTIGGAEASKIQPEERFDLISAVFQDMCVLPHTVAENISMKEMKRTDKAAAAKSLEKAGIGRLAGMLDTPLTRAVDDSGIELSGGETQKLMMARAIYKNAPILILDEPTAALDPIAESETYQRFHELSKGKSAVYISHRLAGTRFCDRIVYLDGGEARETGTHEELMKLNGGYAEMYRLQSQYYTKGGGNNEKYV